MSTKCLLTTISIYLRTGVYSSKQSRTRDGALLASILTDLIHHHINWTGGHDVRFRDGYGLLRMLTFGGVDVVLQVAGLGS